MNYRLFEPEEYDELPIPKLLYKYRDWNNKWHKTILIDQLLYLARPDSFEDTLDCNIPVRYDLLTDKEIFQIYFNESKNRYPYSDRKGHRKFAREWKSKKMLQDPIRIEENREVSRKDFNNKYGVLCLTEDPANIEMWDKYTANHTGFCIGFNGKEMLRDSSRFGLQGQVEYVDNLPIIRYSDDFVKRGVINALHKLKKWSFEKEYRVSKVNYSPINDEWRSVPIESVYFLEIIFGKDMTEEHKHEIIELSNTKFPNVTFKQAKFDEIDNTKIVIENYF